MAFCKSYEKLERVDQREMLAKIIHLIEHDDFTFQSIEQLIALGEVKGHFLKVKIGHLNIYGGVKYNK